MSSIDRGMGAGTILCATRARLMVALLVNVAAVLVAVGPAAALPPDFPATTIQLPAGASDPIVIGSSYTAVLSPEGKMASVFRGSLLNDEIETIYRSFHMEGPLETNGDVVALTESTYERRGARQYGYLKSKVIRISRGEKTVIATGRFKLPTEREERLAEARNEGSHCGTYATVAAVTDAGEVIVQRIKATRKGRPCRNSKNSNTERFELVGADGSRKKLFSATRTPYGDDLVINDIAVSEAWYVDIAGRQAVFGASGRSFVMDIDSGARSPLIRETSRSSYSVTWLMQDGTPFLMRRLIRKDDWITQLITLTLEGGIWRKSPVLVEGSDMGILACGDRFLTFVEESWDPVKSVMLVNPDGSSAGAIEPPSSEKQLTTVLACDEHHVIFASFDAKMRMGLIVRPLPN